MHCSGAVPARQASLTHRRIVLVYCALMLGMLLASLDETILAVALPTIAGELGALDRLAWVVTAYILAATIAAPIAGKLGDLHGRKLLFQLSIMIFLAGSVLSRAAQGMTELICFRIVQGLGAGGLIVGSQAISGDIVPARQRARYQGYIAATFAISSLAGPALGGLFVDSLSWRWIFYANLPLGALALLVVALVLPTTAVRPSRPLDVAGVVLLTAGIGPLTLALTLGGTEYAWSSATIVGLGAIGAAMLAAFVAQELRALEPIVPLRLFRNPVFSAAAAAGFLANLARWSAIVYLPLYLQVVRGVSPTDSGLQLLPLLAAMVVSSIVSGRVITRLGRYKAVLVAGTGCMVLGMYLLSRLDATTSERTLRLSMVVLGVGFGLALQVLVLAVQNAVERRDLGVATSTAAFLRAIGASFGVAIFGTVFANRLASDTGLGADLLREAPADLWTLPPEIRDGTVEACSQALHNVFLWALPFAVLAFVVAALSREAPLAEELEAEQVDRAAVSASRPVP